MSKRTHDDYLNRLYMLQSQMRHCVAWRWNRELYGLRHTLFCNCLTKLSEVFERTYRNYSAWCRRNHEENLWRYFG